MKTPAYPLIRSSWAASFGSIALALTAPCVLAADITWTGTSATWSTSGNWSGTNTPPISDDALIFGAAGPGGLLLNNDLTSGSFNLAGITYNSGAGAFVIGNGTTSANVGNTFVLTGNITNNSTSLQTINNPFSMTAVRTFTTSTGGGDITLGGDISGTGGGIIKAGSGSLTLTGNNSYTGNTTVSVGQLNINSATAIGAGSLSLALGTSFDNTSGGTVAIANNISGSMDINFGGTNSLTTTGSLTHNNSGRTVWVNGSGVLSVGNVINATSGTGRMRKNGIGTLVVNGTGPSGGYEVYGGTLWLAANNPSSVSMIVNTGTLILSGNNTSHGDIDLETAGKLQLQANVGNTTSGISSAMKPQAFSTTTLPSGSTIQLRSDTAVLFNNTAAPTTTAAGDRPAGTLNFDVGKVASGTGQVLQFGQTASSFMVNRSTALATTINVTGSDGYALQLGTIVINNTGTVTFNPTTANLIVAGVTNGGSLIKNGAGSLTSNGDIGSSGANIATTVNQGTLTSKGNFFGSLAVNNTNTTDLGTDTVLNLNTTADTTTGSLSGSISTPTSGTNTATINTQTSRKLVVKQTAVATYAGVIAGAGGFELGTGSTHKLTLTGNNTYAGGTTITAGTVAIGHINSFGSGTVDIGSVATVTNSANLSGAPGLANTFTGSGAFTAAAGSGLQVTLSGNWTAFSGTVSSSAGAGGDIVFNGAFSSGVSLTTSENAAYVNNYNLNNSNGMIVQNQTGVTGTYKMGSYQSAVGSTLRNSGAATGHVIFEIGKLGTNTTVAGTIGGTTAGASQNTSLTKVGSGTLTLGGANTYAGATTVSAGTLALSGAGSIATSSNYIVNGTLDVSAITPSTFTVATGKTLSGTGTVTASGKTLSIEGTHAVGNSNVGQQSISGTASYAAGSIFEWQLGSNVENGTWDDDNDGGTAAINTRGSAFDAVNVTGDLNIDGTASTGAVFKIILGTAFDGNDAFWLSNRSWDTFTATTSSTAFTNFKLYNSVDLVNQVSYASFGSFTYGFTGSTGTLTWTAVPEPTTTLAGLLLTAGLLRRRRDR